MRSLAALVLVVAACASATPKDSSPDGPGGGTGADAPPGSSADAPAIAPADANDCAHQPCALAPQCGCAAGSACDLDSNNLATGGTECVAAGAGTETSTCTTDSDCAAGYTCVGSPARCEKWCGSDGDCLGGPASLCIIDIVYGSSNTDVPGAVVCTTACDPTSTDPVGCPASWACHIYQESTGQMRLLTDCDPSGAAGDDGSCSANTDCRAGMDCIQVTDGEGDVENECLPTCKVGGSCPSGTGSCMAFATPVTIGGIQYGVCL